MRAIKRKGLQKLARARLREAKLLLSNGEYAGAYYLAGYAIECALKACIAKKVKRHDFPDRSKVNTAWQHNLQALADLADLKDEIEDDRGIRRRWSTVKDWSEHKRYDPNIKESDARSLLNAIDDPNTGVFPWLKDRW